jgi:spore coat polysaccharide biosynthesis predicted glycosyltransferase SpsG
MVFGIRADGGFKIGLGHIYKAIWLGDALKARGFEVVLLTTEDYVSNRLIADQNFETVIFPKDWNESQKIQQLNQWVFQKNPKFLVIDHWSWPKEFWTELECQDKTILVGMDVPPEGIIHFDIAFQGIRETLESNEYSKKGCRVFSGVDYLVMSPNFQTLRNGWKSHNKFKKILLTFGGTDVANFSIKSLEFFSNQPWGFEISLVLGPGISDLESIQRKVDETSLRVKMMPSVSCLPKSMTNADLVIATAGLGTLSELALTGAPAIVISAVDHQVYNALKFSSYGIVDRAEIPGVWTNAIANDLNGFLENPNQLAELSEKWDGLVDGEGIDRIVGILESY